MNAISLTPIRKKLSSLHIDYKSFILLEKTDKLTVVLTITSRFLHDDDVDLALGILDEDYHVEKMRSNYEEYKLTLRQQE